MPRKNMPIRRRAWAGAAALLAGALASGLPLVVGARAQSAQAGASPATHEGSVISDAQLIDALQKRLLIPDPNNIQLGAVKPSPLAGVVTRLITVTNTQGQKGRLEYFSGPRGDKGILAERFGFFDVSHPWQTVDLKDIHLDDRPTLGPRNAPVTIIEFADFECPYCARAFGQIETLVQNDYKNRAQLIWKNFPLAMHPWAEQAAIAAECAHEQNPTAFWDFARSLYRDQDAITPENLRSHIDGYASALGLDGKALNACMLGKSAEARVEQDMHDGQAIHLMSTPTFVINGVAVVGLPDSSVFDFVINGQPQRKQAAR